MFAIREVAYGDHPGIARHIVNDGIRDILQYVRHRMTLKNMIKSLKGKIVPPIRACECGWPLKETKKTVIAVGLTAAKRRPWTKIRPWKEATRGVARQ